MTRRNAILSAATALTASAQAPTVLQRKSKLKQSVCSSVFGRGTPLEVMCWEAARLGFKGFDLRGVQDFPILKKYGLVPTMVPGGGGTIPEGPIRKQNHDAIEKACHEVVDACAAAGAPNAIVLSGERKGLTDAEGMDNCVAFFNRVKKHAEDKGVTLCMELLNSKVNHKDYMCDRTSWGVEVCKRVGSPRVKLLYDIYHMQIMEGDLVRTIRENFQWIAHFHTAGNPGRNQLDDTQEIQYRSIALALADLNYQGYIAHEYSPVRGKDPIKCLEQAAEIFDVT
jgi:hydroxypyruvate isomerase